ncbi:LOW QUALITY PROTEIN: hypothetical protein NC651_019119 [Populus alba x Populus x berolinensis]|nr:LOW QUALITY PROTEIN: hypothetical protein NC651_019119 [Populus alba x Populus x berolinensis]
MLVQSTSPNGYSCASLHFPSSSSLSSQGLFFFLSVPSTSFSFTPFLTVCSRQTPTKSTNARNSNYTNNTGIAYLNYPVVVKAQTSSSSALSREPMLPPFNVLITGSTKELVDAFNPGIGYALAKEFLKAGDNVIICSRSEIERRIWRATCVGISFTTLFSKIFFVSLFSLMIVFHDQFSILHTSGYESAPSLQGTKCDVREGKDVEGFGCICTRKSEIHRHMGSNAYSYKPLAEASDEDLIEVVTTNTLGLMICCREAIKMMLNQPRGGHIFNIDGAGSDGRPTPRFAAYGATKRSVVHLTKSLQAELQMQDVQNVVVHNLSPGMVTTDLLMSGSYHKAEPAEVVAEYLVPNIRSIPANGSAKPTYIRFLTGVKANSQIFSLQPFQSQSLLRIQQLLNYPSFPTSFDSTTDFCNIEPTPSLTLVCYEDNITQLHIVGNSGVPPTFSTDYFFATVASLSSLKVLSLVSLGFSGPLPESIGQLSSLEILNASSNYFSGSIPASLSSLRSLQTLILDHNKFSGEVPGLGFLPVLAVLSLKNNSLSGYLPNSLTRLESLRIFSLSKNHLSGQVPDLHNLTNLQVLHSKVVTLVLRNNSFHSGIPADLVTYHQLQKLDLSFNGFVGPFLPSLLSSPPMNYLDISHNKFSGMLFENMSCHAELAYVDLSSNLLTGELPTCLNLSSESRIVLYARNCLSNKEQEQHPFNICHNEALAVKILPRDDVKHQRHDKEVLASSTTGGVVGGIAIVGLVFLFVKRVYSKDDVKKPQTRILVKNLSSVNTVKLLSDARYISQTMSLELAFLIIEPFLWRSSRRQQITLMPRTYLVKIQTVRHNHLISALGHCFDCCQDDSSTSRIFNIFEFVPNGTLRDYISGIPENKLKWPQRIGAAIGAARGIQFLHTGIVPGVFPNNLKIKDVVLDHDLLVGAAVSSGTKQNFGTRDRHEDKEDIYDLGLQVTMTVDDVARRNIVDPAINKECSDESLKIMMEYVLDVFPKSHLIDHQLMMCFGTCSLQHKFGEFQNKLELTVSCS